MTKPEFYGAKRNGTQDDLPAFKAALSSMASGDVLELTPGAYYLSDSLVIPQGLRIDIINARRRAPAKLLFARNVPGLIVDDYCTIANIEVKSLGGTNTNAHGLKMKFGSVVQSVSVFGFPGDGFHVQASARTDGGNCNRARIEDCEAVRNRGNGIYLEGEDANVISIERPRVDNNGQWGIDCKAFLGPVRIELMHACENEVGAVRINGSNNRSRLDDPYVEGDALVQVDAPAMCIGGIGGRLEGTGVFIRDGRVRGLIGIGGAQGKGSVTFTPASLDVGDALFELRPNEGDTRPLRLHYSEDRYVWRWAGSSYSRGPEIASYASSARDHWSIGEWVFPVLGIGHGSVGVQIHPCLGGPPTQGNFRTGDLAIDGSPKEDVGAYQCVESGIDKAAKWRVAWLLGKVV